MDIQLSYNDEERIKSRLLKSQGLEMAYRESIQKSDIIVHDEEARRLRLQILLLENEKDDLRERLALDDERIDILEEERDKLQLELQIRQEDASRYSNELRSKDREVNNLKVELTSLQGANMDSTKLLTEKLSLTRELATLKPEVEHLRSQVAHQQTVLSEKLALQRQVSTLEVELENEKRSSKRAAQKSGQNELEAEMQQQMEELRKEHAREKREMEKALKDMEKESKESEAKITLLEGKLEQMKTKLRTAKDQLKECQMELAKARATASKVAETSKPQENNGKTSRKRSAVEISGDTIIGTPDGAGPRRKRSMKRGKIDQTMLGEKSTFSITPYLNRTVNITAGSPEQGKGSEILEENGDGNAETDKLVAAVSLEENATAMPDSPLITSSPIPKSSKSRNEPLKKPPAERGVLQEARTGTAGNNKPTTKRLQAKPVLDKVVEEETDENRSSEHIIEPAGKGVNALGDDFPKLQLKSAEDVGPKKKKRKLLSGSKTLFDEEEGETSKRPARSTSRLLKKAGSKGAKTAAFTEFSPLKRDRRGANASFLA